MTLSLEPETLSHILVRIDPADLHCADCGEVAMVGYAPHRIVTTGVRIRGGNLAACQACLAEWRTTHPCKRIETRPR